VSFSQIIFVVGAILFVYFLAKKPDLVAIGLFVAIIADVNFDLSGLPLNFRAMMTVSLMARILMDKEKKEIPSFFGLAYTRIILFFVVYVVLIALAKDMFSMDVLKESVLDIISAYLAFYYFFQKKSLEIFKWGMILGALVCVADLAYTYKTKGSFPAVRIYYLFTPKFEYLNHNFFGEICSLGFIYLLSDYLNSNKHTKINLYLMPVMFLGVLLSTSRSALLCVAIVALGLIAKGLFSAGKGKKATTLITVVIGCVFLTLFIFTIIQDLFAIDSEFLQTITARLIDEPLAMINRSLGNNYNANSLDSMDWRVEASNIAYDTFIGLPMDEKLFGTGINGFAARNYGNGYDAHNGILLMMIEFGIIGSFLYFGLMASLLWQAYKYRLQSPVVACLVFLLLYITSHNKELTSILAFLITGSLAAQIYYAKNEEEFEEEEEIDPEQEVQLT
jgi:hypothetical protein